MRWEVVVAAGVVPRSEPSDLTRESAVELSMKLVAAGLVGTMGVLWLSGFTFFESSASNVHLPALLGLTICAVGLCGIAWAVRNARLRAVGRTHLIEARLVRDRAIGAIGATLLISVFALVLDRVGDRPHRSFGVAVEYSFWFGAGMVSLITCAICLAGGGRR